MKRTGFVLAIVGFALGLLPTLFYSANSFFELYDEDWYEAAIKTSAALDLASSVVLLIAFIVITSSITSRPAPPQGYASAPGYPPAGSPFAKAPFAPAPAGPPAGPASAEDRLKRLRELRDQGHLSPAEHDEQRARILGSL